ncbi:hypothetical protein ACSBM8_01865 [Sphingomonas sp. ASY06-1R]|uniref:hypothetical protein n=1 Tax=Sphingomonas sp. ASY06-1R TaxID=3445771 RepID=UPI003FA20CF7
MVPTILIAAAALAAPAGGTSGRLSDAQSAGAALYRALPTDGFDFRRLRFAPPLRELMRREAALANGEEGLIDAVPLCDCQDVAEDYAFTLHARKVGAKAEEVTVRLVNDTPSSFRIDMVRLPAGWAIADIHGPRHPSLVAYLRRHLPAR